VADALIRMPFRVRHQIASRVIAFLVDIANANHYHLHIDAIARREFSMRQLLLIALLAAAPALAADEEIWLVIQDHRFQPEEVVVPAGRKVKLVVENRDATPE
jgi:hypothetical protein